MLANEIATKDSKNKTDSQTSCKDKKSSIVERFADEAIAHPIQANRLVLQAQSLGSPTATCSPKTRPPIVTSGSAILPSTAIPKKSRWRRIQRDKEWLKTHSQDYVPRARNGDVKYNLTIIDNPVREPECNAATTKQWDTIIKEAKEVDKVPAAAKMAKFYRLGSTIGSPYLKDGLHGIPRYKKDFKRTLREKELDTILKRHPVPLKDYTRLEYWKKPLSKYGMGPREKGSPKGFEGVGTDVPVAEESKSAPVSCTFAQFKS
jgi:hypothetical protein